MKRKKKKTPIDRLKKYESLFTTSEAEKAGVSKYTLSRLSSKDEIIRIGYGLYMLQGSGIDPTVIDFAYATVKFGSQAIICGLTALFYHNIINEVPIKIWVMVPKEKVTQNTKYRLIRVSEIKNVCIEKHKFFRITNIERTLIDALVYEKKIGIRTAISAILKALKEKKTSLNAIMKASKKLGKEKVLKKYWETIIASMEDQ